jgi:hypothetical protein
VLSALEDVEFDGLRIVRVVDKNRDGVIRRIETSRA